MRDFFSFEILTNAWLCREAPAGCGRHAARCPQSRGGKGILGISSQEVFEFQGSDISVRESREAAAGCGRSATRCPQIRAAEQKAKF